MPQNCLGRIAGLICKIQFNAVLPADLLADLLVNIITVPRAQFGNDAIQKLCRCDR